MIGDWCGSPVFWQIQFLIENLTKKNYDLTKEECLQLCKLYGHNAFLFTLSCLFSYVDLKLLKKNDFLGVKMDLLSDLVHKLWEEEKMDFGTKLRSALLVTVQRVQQEKKKKSGQNADNIQKIEVLTATNVELLCKKVLKLNTAQQLCLSVSLSQSYAKQIADEGAKLLVALLFGILDASDSDKVNSSIASQVVMLLKTHPMFLHDKDLGNSCLVALESALPDVFNGLDVVPYMINDPLCVDLLKTGKDGDNSEFMIDFEGRDNCFNHEDIGNTAFKGLIEDLELGEVLLELGCSCTFNSEVLRKVLEPILNDRGKSINEADIANVLGMMARTQSKMLMEEMGNSSIGDKKMIDSNLPLEMDFSRMSINNNNSMNNSNKKKKNSNNKSNNTVSLSPSSQKGWDVGTFIHIAKELAGHTIDANLIITQMNNCCPGFDMKSVDKTGFDLIIRAYKLITGGKPLPGMVLLDCSKANESGICWKSKDVQMVLLYHAATSSGDNVLFSNTGIGRPMVTIPNGIATRSNRAWEMVDFIATLDTLAASGYSEVVRTLIIEGEMQRYPELILLSLVNIKSKADSLKEEILTLLLPKILMSVRISFEPLLPKLDTLNLVWQHDPNVILRSIVAMYARDESILFFFVDLVSKYTNGLNKLLSIPNTSLVLDAAVIASRRDPSLINFQEWINLKTFANHDPVQLDSFIKGLCLTLEKRLNQQVSPQSNSISYSINETECMASMAQKVMKENLNLPVSHDEKYKFILNKIIMSLKSNNSISNVTSSNASSAVSASGGSSSVGNESNLTMDKNMKTKETSEIIEKQANMNLQMIYRSDKTTTEIADFLKRLKNSDNTSDQDVFNCMVHLLLDEYRFLHKYPEKELRVTGILFGILIEDQLIISMVLGIALKYILDALHKPLNSPMFRFGLTALEQFKGRLCSEWSQTIATQVINIPHFKDEYPALVREIEEKIRNNGNLSENEISAQNLLMQQQKQGGREMPSSVFPSFEIASTSSSMPGTVSGLSIPTKTPGFMININPLQPLPLRGTEKTPEAYEAVCTKIKELVRCHIELTDSVIPPASDVEDELGFLVNNLTLANVEDKVGKIKDLLKPELYEWFAYYVVAKRVATQANFHAVYLSFLDKIDLPELLEHVRFRTLYTVRKYLSSNDIVTSFTERSLLKNLGSWLGCLTLGKNKPLLHRDVNLKALLIDGYGRGWLIAVVPFAAKILDGSKHSTVFNPKNPWIRGIMRTLAEFYHLADLKLNLKFEIEVLCKSLGIDLKAIKPSDVLGSYPPPNRDNNPDFNARVVDKRMNPPSPGVASSQQPISTPPQGPVPKVLEKQTPTKGSEINKPGSSDITSDTVIPNLAAYVHINPNLQLFQQQPSLCRVVPVAVDRAIYEIIQPVVERSVTIACITAREMIVKDFAMEPNEKKMRKAANLMVSNLAGALALVTCKDPLRVSISNHLRSFLQRSAKAPDDQAMQQLIEQVVQVCSAENLDLGCMLIEKAATEKAMRDIDEQIDNALTVRRDAGKQGRPYFDMSLFQSGSRYPAALPDNIRPSPNPSGLSQQQLQVYDAFQRPPRQPIVPPSRSSMASSTITGGEKIPNTATGPVNSQQQRQRVALGGDLSGVNKQNLNNTGVLAPNQAVEKWRICLNELDRLVMEISNASPNGRISPLNRLPRDHEILNRLREIQQIGNSRAPIPMNQNDSLLLHLVKYSFKRLYDIPPGDKLLLEVYLAVLVIFADLNSKHPDSQVAAAVKLNVTEWVITSPQEHKFNLVVTIGLIKNRLLIIQDFDVYLSKLLISSAGTNFAMEIIQECILANRYVQITDMLSTLDGLQKIVLMRGRQNGTGPIQEEYRGLQQLLDNVRSAHARDTPRNQVPVQQQQDSMQAPSQQQHFVPGLFLRSDDQPGLRQQVAQLLHTWIQLCNRPNGAAHESVHRPYLSLLQQQGALKGDENANRFFRITTELCVESCLTRNASTNSPGRNGESHGLNYMAIDAFSFLVVLLVKYAEVRARSALLSMVLDVISNVMHKEFVMRKARGVETGMDQRPYFRLFLNLQKDLTLSYEAEGVPEEYLLSLLVTAFADVYHRVLQPKLMPTFALAWLELISHKSFMPKLLKSSVKDAKGWFILEMLLVDILEFLYPYLKESQIPPSVKLMYKGILRILLVLLHDFPEFLCAFHFSLCNVIPSTCIQLRNLILSAIPRVQQLPDPFLPNLNIDRLPEAQASPNILSSFTNALIEFKLKHDLDLYLKSEQSDTFLMQLNERILINGASLTRGEYNVQLINSLILYTGVFAISQLNPLVQQNQNETLLQIITQKAKSLTSLKLFEHLVNNVEPEGRYHVLNAMANQLRFPSTHSHLFSCLLLYLFQEGKDDLVREQITRILLERSIVSRPQPWALLATFITLLKNKSYGFWDYKFTSVAPEINKLLENVARSCRGVPLGT